MPNTALSELHAQLTQASNPECTEEHEDDEHCHDIMDGYEAVLKAEYERNTRRRDRCLAVARKVMYRRHYQSLMTEVTETNTSGFKITKDGVKGHRDLSRKDGLWLYCHQYVNGGLEGDSFAGQIWIRISKRHFLTFHYSE